MGTNTFKNAQATSVTSVTTVYAAPAGKSTSKAPPVVLQK